MTLMVALAVLPMGSGSAAAELEMLAVLTIWPVPVTKALMVSSRSAPLAMPPTVHDPAVIATADTVFRLEDGRLLDAAGGA